MNDNERSQWIDNHEPLYLWFLSSRLSKRKFMRTHRQAIDDIISAVKLNPPTKL